MTAASVRIAASRVRSVLVAAAAVGGWLGLGPGHLARAAEAAPPSALVVAPLQDDEPRIEGSQCSFAAGPRSGDILKGDWDRKMWMRIDGEMVEFVARRKAGEAVSIAKGRWKEMFHASGASLAIDLAEGRHGDDSVDMRGTITVRKGSRSRAFSVKGGCAA